MFEHTLKPNVAAVYDTSDPLFFQKSITENGVLKSRTTQAAGVSRTLEELHLSLTDEEKTDCVSTQSGHKTYRDRVVSWRGTPERKIVNVWALKATFQKAGLLGGDDV